MNDPNDRFIRRSPTPKKAHPMTFCRGCGHQIHITAPSCPQCGAVQHPTPSTAQPEGTLWLPVPALVCGLIAVLALLDPSDAEMDRIVGTGMFAVAAIVLAGLGLARQKRGQGMSIAGLVLGVIGLLGAIGS